VRTDRGARAAFLCEFILMTEDDWSALGDSIDILAPKLPAILDAIYAHLLSFDDTHRVFLGTRGEVDPAYIVLRQEHLTDWILRSINGGEDLPAFAQFITDVARRHTGVAGEPERVVAPRYLVGLMSFVQSQILSSLIDTVVDDSACLKRYALAWNKLLMLELELFLKEVTEHSPAWD
jgi:hypothetical protein